MELSIAVAASAQSASTSYDIPNVAKHVDFINVMAYDFTGTWAGKVGFNAPLEGQGSNNVKSSIEYWLQQGMSLTCSYFIAKNYNLLFEI